MSNRSSASRRAALLARKEAEAKRKRLIRVLIAAAAAVAAAIVAIVTVVIIQNQKAIPKGEQITPPNATKQYGIRPFKPAKLKPDAPVVVVWEDPQCPWCKSISDTYGKTMHRLAEAGEISLEYRLVNALDPGLRNDASLRASRGALIADKFGKFTEYIDEVYAAQPQREGDGFTDVQLRDQIPAKIGLSGTDLTQFQKLYDSQATDDFVSNAEEKRKSENLPVPAVVVNGKTVQMFTNDSSGKVVPAAQPAETTLLKFFKGKG